MQRFNKVFIISDEPDILQVTGETIILAFSTQVLTVLYTGQITPFTTSVVTIVPLCHRHLTRGPATVYFDSKQVCIVAITNTLCLLQNEAVSTLDHWTNVNEPIPLAHEFVEKFIHKLETKTQGHKMDQEFKEKAIGMYQNITRLPSLLRKYWKVNSVLKMDLGQCNKYIHRLNLKDNLPVYHKQFLLKPEHHQFVEQSRTEWLKLGVVRCTKSAYN